MSYTPLTTLTALVDTKVPSTRTISTTAPISGGGDLSANRTFTHDVSGISAGAVAYPASITFDAKGHATAATAGSAPSSSDNHLTWASTATTSTEFLPAFDFSGSISSENLLAKALVHRTGTITAFQGIISTVPGATKTTTFTLRKNGNDTSAVLTFGAAETTKSWSGTVSVAAGDVLSVRVDFTGSNPGDVRCSTGY